MTTLSSGNSVTVTLSPDQYVTVTTAPNTEGMISVSPASASANLESGSPANTAACQRFGPPCVLGKKYGPYGDTVNLTLQCTTGSVDYVLSSGSARVSIDPVTGRISLSVPIDTSGRNVAFVGDSLTEGAAIALPFLPANTPPFQKLTPTNISATYLIAYAPLYGTSNGTGAIDCDTTGRLRYTAFGDTAGAWVDCTVGGIFVLQSANPAYQCYVQTRYTGHAGVTLPGSIVSDTVALSGFPSTNNWFNLIGFATWTIGYLQAQNVNYWMFATTGDTIADISARKQKVAEFAKTNGITWDDIVLLSGANDVFTSTGAAVANGILALVDYFASISQRVHLLEVFPQGAAVATAARRRIVDANRRLAAGVAVRNTTVKLVQTYNLLVDQASTTGDVVVRGTAKAKYEASGIHLMPYAAMIIGQQVANSLRPYYPAAKFSTTSGADTYDATDNPNGNWLSNGKLLGATGGTLGAGAVAPTGWSISGTGMSIAYVTAATMLGADDYGGDWLEVTAPAGITAEVTGTPTINAVAGDVLEISGEIVTRGSTAGMGSIIQFNMSSAAAPHTNMGPYLGQSAANREVVDIVNSGLLRFSQRMVVPVSPGASGTMRLRAVGAAGGTGVAAFRNIVVRKVSP